MNFFETEIKIENVTEELDLAKTFDCGQCFRWEKLSEGSFIGVVFGTLNIIEYNKGLDGIIIHSSSNSCNTPFSSYFDLDSDYVKAQNELLASGDEQIKKGIEVSKGIRLLRQDFYETLISFIISANNNIPRIKKCIELLCKTYGKFICEYEGRDYYSFPEPEALASADPEELQTVCRVGYRAEYIVKASQTYLNEGINIEKIRTSTHKEAVKDLSRFKGVGSKVANCILLFTGLKRDAFPVDVWVERMLIQLYGLEGMSRENMEKWGREHFGKNAGLAQQYLFNYIRTTE